MDTRANSAIEYSSIYATLLPDQTPQIRTDSLVRGIDNYLVDIKLSRRYSTNVKKLIALLIPQLAVANPKSWDNSDQILRVQRSYEDMMTVLLHRVKTDLDTDAAMFLRFAPIKHCTLLIRAYLNAEINQVSARLAELRSQNASEALAVSQRLFWLKKHYDQILYAVHKQVFGCLLKVEERRLSDIAEQHLGDDAELLLEAMFNPLLWVSELSSINLLLNEFSLWNWNREDNGFTEINDKLEELLNSQLAGRLQLPPLAESDGGAQKEIHDELGGLFQSQAFLGPAHDTGTLVAETLNWFEIPSNVQKLFYRSNDTQWLKQVRKDRGFGAWWRERRETRLLKTTLREFTRKLRKGDRLNSLLATSQMRKFPAALQLERVELKQVCQFLVGKVPMSKLLDVASGSISPQKQKELEDLKSQISGHIAKADDRHSLEILLDFARYRRQLKLFRFAHRIFNRMALLTDEDDLKMSKSAGTLYQLPVSSEVEDEDEKICHHCILKADVRGSTSVTDELVKKGLNPASYFSMRFFNPINKILDTYGANKVFIEGDAIILSFLEYEQAPQQWFAVARACGYARDMLKITGSNNRYSQQMGLPLLELGVGICYAEEAPRFLYDGDHPIMISGAIGQADRLSGCSWKLRAAMERGLFNVEVLRLHENDSSSGEKGQQLIRYNVNGITMDEAAFAKLQTEINLKTIRLRLNGTGYLFHVGQYPDINGKKKDLVVREGKIGQWKDGRVVTDPDSTESFFEVVVNRKVIAAVLESYNTQTRPAAPSGAPSARAS